VNGVALLLRRWLPAASRATLHNWMEAAAAVRLAAKLSVPTIRGTNSTAEGSVKIDPRLNAKTNLILLPTYALLWIVFGEPVTASFVRKRKSKLHMF